jgi:PAS domain S-box-containing protein
MEKTRSSQTRSTLFRYGFAVLMVVLVTLLRVPLNPLLGVNAVPFILYFPAILVSGWYGRLGPGLLATFLSALGALYFNIGAPFTFSIPDVNEAFRLGLFLIVGVFINLVTEAWYRSRKALSESENTEGQQRELLQVTLSSIGDAVIATDSMGRVTFMNVVAESLTGWKQEEAAGKPLDVVFRIINEITRATAESPVAKVLRENAVVRLPNHTTLIRKDGTEIPIDDSGAPIKNKEGKVIGVVLAFRDVTARKFSEVRSAFAASIVESSDDAIIGKSLDGVILSWNAGAERMYGYTSDEVVGRHISILAPDERLGEIEQILDTLRQGKLVYHHETIRVRKDRTSIDVALTISPIKNAEGEIMGASTIARDITERKRAEAEKARLLLEIEYQHQRLDNVMANLPGVVWEAWGQPDTTQQRIDFVSDYVKGMLGYSVEEWLATPNFWLTIVHPDDKERAGREAHDIYVGCVGGTSQFRWVTKEGRTIWVESQSVVVCDEAGNPIGMRGVTMDISERKRSEEAQSFLANASSLLASTLDYETTLASIAQLTVPRLADWCVVAIVEEDEQTRVLAVAHVDPLKTEFARELSRRYPPNPNSQTGVSNVLRTGKSELYSEFPDEMLVAAARDDEHLKLLRELGVKSTMVVPLVARGRTLGAIGMISAESGHRFDKTDLALAEDLAHRAAFAVDNARLYREAQKARAEAEQANRAKDEFLATVSHELRTPLNAIVGWSHMLRRNKFDEATLARAMETIERNAKSQARLIEDILDVSRIIMGKLRLDVHPVELAAVIEAAMDAVRPAADAKEIRLQSILDPRASPVSGDPSRLQQIVWNLVSNAVKFTPRGGRIQVRLERVNSHVEIIVSDTGQGINADLLPYIFDRFQQGDSSSTRMHGGLGLGLAIVRHLVELHGGTVHASSPGVGHGTTFTIKLPMLIWHSNVKEDGRVHPTASSGSAPLEPAPLLDGLRVLIVDDEPDTREMLKIMIERFGAQVKVEASSASALEALEQWKPDVIVSDIEMPGEDGYSLIKKIRALDPVRGGTIPAVALTAYARPEDRVRSLSAGYQMHVAKPAEPVELAIVIASLAGRGGKELAR